MHTRVSTRWHVAMIMDAIDIEQIKMHHYPGNEGSTPAHSTRVIGRHINENGKRVLTRR